MAQSWDYSLVIDAVRGVYTDSDGTRRVTDWVCRDGVSAADPYLRREEIPVANGDSVLLFLRDYVAEHSSPIDSKEVRGG